MCPCLYGQMNRQQSVTYSVTPDHLVCLFKTYLCWHQQSQHTVNLSVNVKAILIQPSCLTSSAVLMGRQHPPLFLHSERCRWDEAEGITAVLQGGSWLSKQVGFWSSGWLTYPSDVGGYFLSSAALTRAVSMPCSTSTVLWSRFLLSSCVLLSRGWTEALIAFAFGITFCWMQFCSLPLPERPVLLH